jgi:membrane-associated phospholipid phosphatase
MTLPLVAVLVAGLSAAPAPALPQAQHKRGDPRPELHVDLVRDAAIAATAFALSGALASSKDELGPTECRWCSTNRFDVWMRDRLRWGDTDAARLGSNVGVIVVPIGAAAALALSSGLDGPRQRMLEDFVLVAQAFGVTMLGDSVPKLITGRLRPYARFGEVQNGNVDDRLSFWSGHAALSFSAASAAGTVARLRGYPQWRWILGVGMAGAAATAWFRVAGDRHWATDALAGAAWGTAVGVAVPMLHVRRGAAMSVVPTGTGFVFVMAL